MDRPQISDTTVSDGSAARGFVYALLCYLAWGFLPLYMKAVAHIGTMEVVAHRVLWSLPIAGVVLWLTGRTADIKVAVRTPRMLAMAFVTAIVIAINWGIYVWAIAADRALETSLGYYINPLMTVTLGAVLLGERLDRLQGVAIALALAAVLLLTIEAGGLPWVSLGLALSFAIYGYLRKTLPIGPAQGFFLEVVILALPALGYVIWLQATGGATFGVSGAEDSLLLMLAGPVTAVPLLFYAFGAKLLKISTIGMMQYIAPTIVALLAVFAFNEPFGWDRAIAFALIWVALGLYSLSLLRKHRRAAASRAGQ